MDRIYINNEEVQSVSKITWNDDVDTCATIFNFTCDTKYDTGTIFVYTDDTDFKIIGIIITRDQSEKNKYDYMCFDFGFYLANNRWTIQFRCDAVTAVKQLLKELGLPIGTIDIKAVEINKIYRKEQVSDILKSILGIVKLKTGIEYYIDCKDGNVNILKYEYKAGLQYKFSDFLYADVSETINGFNISESIADLKNKIFINNDQAKNIKSLTFAQDTDSIQKYGLLSDFVDLDKDVKANPHKIAQDKVDELKEPKKSINITMLGTNEMKKGTIIPVKDKTLELDGKYLIVTSAHDIERNRHEVTMDLELQS